MESTSAPLYYSDYSCARFGLSDVLVHEVDTSNARDMIHASGPQYGLWNGQASGGACM